MTELSDITLVLDAGEHSRVLILCRRLIAERDRLLVENEALRHSEAADKITIQDLQSQLQVHADPIGETEHGLRQQLAQAQDRRHETR